MSYFFFLLTILALIHASCFGAWLIKNNNKSGAVFVFAFGLFGLSLSIYRLIAAK